MTQRSWGVVVCTYASERWDDLVRCVDSVLGQSLPADEILVVVDHNDQLAADARERLDGRVKVVGNTGLQGLSGARNTGLSAASTTHVAFIDDDAYAEPGWLLALDSAFGNDADVIGAGGDVRPRWETKPPAWWPDEFHWVVGCSYSGMPSEGGQIRNPIGANMAFVREQVLAAGGFDSRLGRVGKYPAGCEETDLSIRLREHFDGRIVQQSDAVVHHFVPRSRLGWTYFRRRCFAEGRSKAILSRGAAGFGRATSAERSYAVRAVLGGVARRLGRAVTRFDRSQMAQAGALLAGFGFTMTGYLTGLFISNNHQLVSEPAAPNLTAEIQP